MLLIEAGGNPFPLTTVPAVAANLFKDPHIAWTSGIEPQKIGCQALKNKVPLSYCFDLDIEYAFRRVLKKLQVVF